MVARKPHKPSEFIHTIWSRTLVVVLTVNFLNSEITTWFHKAIVASVLDPMWTMHCGFLFARDLRGWVANCPMLESSVVNIHDCLRQIELVLACYKLIVPILSCQRAGTCWAKCALVVAECKRRGGEGEPGQQQRGEREWLLGVREREREWIILFPKFGNGKGMEKAHSQNSGTGREWEKAIPKIWE